MRCCRDTGRTACDEALVAHAGNCATCREVASVSLLLREDSEHSRFDMHVPAAGQVWWRAAVRARLESHARRGAADDVDARHHRRDRARRRCWRR